MKEFWYGLAVGAAVSTGILLFILAGTISESKYGQTDCRPAPGEISHMDDDGWCAITRKGRLVTRYRT